jgi:hypothetical protein
MPLTSSFAQSAHFLQLLEFLSNAPAIGDARFHARNFRLESEIPAERIKHFLGSPLPKIHVNPQQSRDELDNYHKLYLGAAVKPGARTDTFSDTSSRCPDTFRKNYQLEEFRRPRRLCFFRRADDHLVRVEEMGYMTTNAGWPPLDARALLTRVANANRGHTALSDSDRKDCGELFNAWQLGADNRPLCAAFWGDVKGVLSRPEPNWPEELRDRLGLVHHDPAAKLHAIPVVAFRYPIKRIPKKNGTGRPLLVRSTILDGGLNLAFYTGAPGSGVGQTVDLQASDAPLLREVVHPAITFEPGDVWAVGEISAPIPKLMKEARGHHARRLINDKSGSEFAELIKNVDGDLL